MHKGGRDIAVGITTRHRLDGPGIESRWRRGFLHPSRRFLGITKPPTQWVAVITGNKEAGGGVDDPPQSSAEVEERVELYIYSPSVFFIAGYRVNFTFHEFQ